MQQVIGVPATPSNVAEVAAQSGERVLQVLLVTHLFLITFQFLVRAFIVDTTFFRDILMITSVVVWTLTLVNQKNNPVRQERNWMDRLIVLYLCYGLVTVGTSLGNGLGILESFTQFRNYFLPAALYFPAKKAFGSSQGQAVLIGALITINLLMIFDVIGEYIVQQLGYPLSVVPWYPYMFRTGERFIGNEVGVRGSILPEDTPILGILGYPHYTVAPLMALFAFSYPFFAEKNLKEFPGRILSFVGRIPVRVRYGVALLAIMAVFVLGVRTHLISIVLILMILPFFTHPKVLFRNFLILLAAAVVMVSVGLVEPEYWDRFQQGLLSSGARDSSISLILSVRELLFIVNSPLQRLLLGNGDMYSQIFNEVGSFELRLLFFTAAFGAIWLVLFGAIFSTGLIYARRVFSNQMLPPIARVFATGTIGLLIVYMLDVGHYARTMWAPNIDIWVICLGALSAMAGSVPKTLKASASGIGRNTFRGLPSKTRGLTAP